MLKDYIFAHCGDNSIIKIPQKEIQPLVLEMLTAGIQEANGVSVVFFCPKESCGDNAEMNYIAVLSQGYTQLIAKMKEKYPDVSLRVYHHPSHREEDIDNLWLKRHEADENVRMQYVSIMLISAYGICRNEYLKALEGIQIITNKTTPCITKNGKLVEDLDAEFTSGTHNLHNTIADYICNSYFNNMASCRTTILKDAIVCEILRDGKKFSWKH